MKDVDSIQLVGGYLMEDNRSTPQDDDYLIEDVHSTQQDGGYLVKDDASIQ